MIWDDNMNYVTKRTQGQAGEKPARQAVQVTNRIAGDRRWWALAAVLVTLFFGSLDQTVVSTAMPVIIGDLNGFDIYAWVFTAYLITSAVTVPIYGKLSDVYGRKPFYAFGLGIFMIGSALSGQSHTMMELIIFRGLQGIGAGAMLSMPLATIGDIFNPRERGRWMGVISMAFGLSAIIGPFLGGWITDHLGWQWIFYINLPVAALALAGILYALPRVRTEHEAHVDWRGTGLLVAGLVPMLLAFTWAGNQYPWGSPVIVGLFAFSAVMLAVFVWAETRAAEPIIPVEFFKVPIFAVANVVALLLSMGMFGALLFIPLYVQGVLGQSAQNSGAILTPMMGSFIVASILAGLIMTRTGRYKIVALVAAAAAVAGLYLFTRLGANSTWPVVIRDMLFLGVGLGGLMPTLNVAVQNAFPYKVMGVVNAAQQFVRSLGAVIATSVLGGVLVNAFTAQFLTNLPPVLRQAIAGLPPAQQQALSNPQGLTNAQAQAAIQHQFAAFGAQGQALYQQFITAVRQSLASGMERVFLITLFFGVAMLLAALFLPEIGLQHDEFYEGAAMEAEPSPEPMAEPMPAPAPESAPEAPPQPKPRPLPQLGGDD
jgi:EmrB/QacA subfamily drug resistance transporter